MKKSFRIYMIAVFLTVMAGCSLFFQSGTVAKENTLETILAGAESGTMLDCPFPLGTERGTVEASWGASPDPHPGIDFFVNYNRHVSIHYRNGGVNCIQFIPTPTQLISLQELKSHSSITSDRFFPNKFLTYERNGFKLKFVVIDDNVREIRLYKQPTPNP